jgi:hypothetical protein
MTLRLLTLLVAEVAAAYKSPDALQAFPALWADYADATIAHFLCDTECASPPFMIVLPERNDPDRCLAAPLCPACAALPPMVRLTRVVKVLKRMWPGYHLRRSGWR